MPGVEQAGQRKGGQVGLPDSDFTLWSVDREQNWLRGHVTGAVTGPQIQKGPAFNLTLCHHHLEILNNAE